MNDINKDYHIVNIMINKYAGYLLIFLMKILFLFILLYYPLFDKVYL